MRDRHKVYECWATTHLPAHTIILDLVEEGRSWDQWRHGKQ